MKMLLAEGPPRKAGNHLFAGQFRLKPVYRLPKTCPLCGATTHIGRTRCLATPFIPKTAKQPELANLKSKQHQQTKI